MTNVLVTGGTGFIGGALVRRLLKENYDVRVFDDFSRSKPENLADIRSRITMIEGNVCDTEGIRAAMEGCDIVFHLAAVNGTENFYTMPDRVLEVGVKGTINTMDAALAQGVRRYILASSSEAYQQPTHIPTSEMERLIVPDVTNPRYSYGGSKIIGELLALHYLRPRGTEAVIFRPHNVYGPGGDTQHVIPEFIERLYRISHQTKERPLHVPIKGDGTQKRSFSYIDDTVHAILLLAEKGKDGEIYNIGDDDEITMRELAQKIGAELNLDLVIVPGESPKGETSRRCPDIAKIRALGYRQQVPLEEGLHRTCRGEWEKIDRLAHQD